MKHNIEENQRSAKQTIRAWQSLESTRQRAIEENMNTFFLMLIIYLILNFCKNFFQNFYLKFYQEYLEIPINNLTNIFK